MLRRSQATDLARRPLGSLSPARAKQSNPRRLNVRPDELAQDIGVAVIQPAAGKLAVDQHGDAFASAGIGPAFRRLSMPARRTPSARPTNASARHRPSRPARCYGRNSRIARPAWPRYGEQPLNGAVDIVLGVNGLCAVPWRHIDVSTAARIATEGVPHSAPGDIARLVGQPGVCSPARTATSPLGCCIAASASALCGASSTTPGRTPGASAVGSAAAAPPPGSRSPAARPASSRVCSSHVTPSILRPLPPHKFSLTTNLSFIGRRGKVSRVRR